MVSGVISAMTNLVVSQTGAILIAALLGSAATFIGNVLLKKRQQRKKREALRRALRTEMKSMYPRMYALSEYRPKPEEVEDIFLTSIYESNADKIGILTNDEVENIVRFYGEIVNAQRAIQRQNGRRNRFDQQYLEVHERKLHERALQALNSVENELGIQKTSPNNYNPREEFGPTDAERRLG